MFAWIVLLGAATIAAPPDGATLSGVVRDAESGAPVTDARVALTDLDRATATGPDGRYVFRDVPAGPQHLSVRRIGYAPRTLHALVPAEGWVTIHVSLRPEPVELPGVAASPAVAVRGGDEAARVPHPSTAVSAAAVRNHPMLAEPDFFAAVAGGAAQVEPEAPRGLHVRGGRADQVAFLLDGVPVLDPLHSVGLFSAWNPDALARLRLDPRSADADALSGVVSAETRRPGARLRTQGALSNTQLRVTVDGPLPARDAGFLLSGRRGFPGFLDPDDEPSYVRGRSGDLLAALSGAVAGGRLRLLGYANANRTGTGAFAGEETDDSVAALARNRFEWSSLSVGGEWAGETGGAGRLRLRAWSASSDASARWASDDPAAARLASSRDDVGAAATYEVGGGDADEAGASTVVGLRATRSRTVYRVGPADGGAASYGADASTEVAALHASHARALGADVRVEAGLLGGWYDGEVRLAPRVDVRWTPRPALTLSASAGRAYQSEQSLRNAESVVGLVFPASLHVGAGAPGVPLARGDEAIAAAELRPAPGVRIAAQGYARDFDGLLLVAPATAQPFATDGFAVGSGSSRGAALELSVSGSRHAVLAGYGVQHVRLSARDTAYVPGFASAHTAEVGAIVFPQAAASLRASVTGVFGRRGTAVGEGFEWESCNLLDLGCEFAGSPQRRDEPLGSTHLPAYARVDLGARKHWHLRVAGAETLVALHATVTNVLGRRNVLTMHVDPVTGERRGVEMRARAPLVVGVDWRF